MLRNNSLHAARDARQQVFPEAHGVPDYDGRRAVRPLGWVGPGGEVRSNNTRSSAFVIILQDAPPPTKLGTYRFVAATVGSTVTVRRAKVAVRSERRSTEAQGHTNLLVSTASPSRPPSTYRVQRSSQLELARGWQVSTGAVHATFSCILYVVWPPGGRVAFAHIPSFFPHANAFRPVGGS